MAKKIEYPTDWVVCTAGSRAIKWRSLTKDRHEVLFESGTATGQTRFVKDMAELNDWLAAKTNDLPGAA